MHDQLFTHQKALEDRDLIRYAGRIGLNIERSRHFPNLNRLQSAVNENDVLC
jgi:hypothetical protein